jgi:hypothetical protein
VATTDESADLQRFEDTILSELQRVGLPTERVVVELDSVRGSHVLSAS